MGRPGLRHIQAQIDFRKSARISPSPTRALSGWPDLACLTHVRLKPAHLVNWNGPIQAFYYLFGLVDHLFG